MLDFKKLLGSDYRDDLTDAEKLELLGKLNLADLSSGDYVAKGKLTAKDTEIADLKKQIGIYQEKENASLTDAQKKEKEHQDLIKSKEDLEKLVAEYKLKETIMASGYSAEECSKIIEAQNKGENVAKVYADIMKSRTEEAVKSAKAEMTKMSTPPAPSGNDMFNNDEDSNEDEYVKLAKSLAADNQVDTKSIEQIKGAYSFNNTNE